MFSIKDFFSKCDQIRSGLVTFTEEILSEKLHFLYSVNADISKLRCIYSMKSGTTLNIVRFS